MRYKAITDFIFVETPLEKADAIFIPGGSKPELATQAATLFKEGYADLIVPSGSTNTKLNTETGNEAVFLKDQLLLEGVPEKNILMEETATNTLENGLNTKQLLEEKGYKIKSAIIVCKNYHSRRVQLSYQHAFGMEIAFHISTVVDDKDIRPDNWMDNEEKIDVVMGEVEKIGRYFRRYIKEGLSTIRPATSPSTHQSSYSPSTSLAPLQPLQSP